MTIDDELDEARQELVKAGLIRARRVESHSNPDDDVWEYTLLDPATGRKATPEQLTAILKELSWEA